jgi:hypothetical protein
MARVATPLGSVVRKIRFIGFFPQAAVMNRAAAKAMPVYSLILVSRTEN